MTDLDFIKQFDKNIEEKYNRFKKENKDFANEFLKNEKRYWEDNGENGKYAPEPID